jgi:hypothetical protein
MRFRTSPGSRRCRSPRITGFKEWKERDEIVKGERRERKKRARERKKKRRAREKSEGRGRRKRAKEMRTRLLRNKKVARKEGDC